MQALFEAIVQPAVTNFATAFTTYSATDDPDTEQALSGTSGWFAPTNTDAAGRYLVSPTVLNFGSVLVGSTSPPLMTTLTNKGAIAVAIDSIAVTGTYASWFPMTENCPNSLAAGASCTISVRFAPIAAATRSAKVTITTSATATPLSVTVKGTGAM